MAGTLGTPVDCGLKPRAQEATVIPVSAQSNWVRGIISNLATADNSGNSVADPRITGRTPFKIDGRADRVQVRVRYDDGHATIETNGSPIIALWGLDHAGEPFKLFDAAGNHEVEMTVTGHTAQTDYDDETDCHSDPHEWLVQGAEQVVPVIKRGFNGSGTDSLSYLDMRAF